MKPVTRAEFAALLRDAGITMRLRRELRFTPEAVERWEDYDFLPVVTRSHNEGVLLYGAQVVSFRLQNRTPNSAGRLEAIICDLCATWQSGPDSAVITFPRRLGSVSFLCCGDLRCSLHVRGLTSQAVRSRAQLRETITPEARITRLHQRMEKVIEAVL